MGFAESAGDVQLHPKRRQGRVKVRVTTWRVSYSLCMSNACAYFELYSHRNGKHHAIVLSRCVGARAATTSSNHRARGTETSYHKHTPLGSHRCACSTCPATFAPPIESCPISTPTSATSTYTFSTASGVFVFARNASVHASGFHAGEC